MMQLVTKARTIAVAILKTEENSRLSSTCSMTELVELVRFIRDSARKLDRLFVNINFSPLRRIL